MKTLVNKANPAIRITAPDITLENHCYYIWTDDGDCIIEFWERDWTLVEEEPEFEHRRKDTIYFLETAKTHYVDISELEKCIEWLKGLNSPVEADPVDLKNEAVAFCFDNGINTTPYQATRIAHHFYELGRNTKKQ